MVKVSEALIESATACHDAQVVGLCQISNPLRLTVLTAKSVDYNSGPQHLQSIGIEVDPDLPLRNKSLNSDNLSSIHFSQRSSDRERERERDQVDINSYTSGYES